jgi:hypothetical protein
MKRERSGLRSIPLLVSTIIVCVVPMALARAAAEDTCGRIGGSDWSPRRGKTWVYGGGFGGLPGPYLSGGVIAGTVPGKCNKCAMGAESSGVLLQVAAGLYSGRASVGYASSNPMFGYGFRVAVDRAWRQKGDVSAGSTYLGPEVVAMIGPASLSTGLLWRTSTSPDSSSPSRRWSWSLALGF